MKKWSLLVVAILLPTFAYLQEHDVIWMMGYSGGRGQDTFGISILNFQKDSLEIQTDQNILYGFDFANVTMCDSLGNFQFSSNGVAIYVQDTIEVEGSRGFNVNELNGYILPQGVLSFPHPRNDSTYAFFHGRKGAAIPQIIQLFYSEIDMKANEGLGEVILRMQPIVEGDTLLFGHLTAVKHANGRDWWILTQRRCSKDKNCIQNYFHRVLITPDEVKLLRQPILRSDLTETGAGQSVFTPDGTKYVGSHSIRDGIPHTVEVYDFDRCIGWLSNKRVVKIDRIPDTNDRGGGLVISANSRFAYLILHQRIIQLDLWARDIQASAISVAEYDGFEQDLGAFSFPTRFLKGQLAPDGKIYISTTNSTRYLHVIHNPNEKGLACNVEQHGIELPTFNSFSIPNHPNYRLGAWEGSPCDTLSPISSTEQIVANEVKFFPNPSTGFLQLELDEDVPISQLEVRFYSLTAQLIQSSQGQNTFDLSHFSNGIYIASVFINGQVVGREKIVVQR
ncbi:MAG: T9SS type A sorting domain-containing protein [Bacteroidota bacterium]